MALWPTATHDAAPPRVAEGDEPVPRRRNWLGWVVAVVVLASCFLFIDLRQVVGAVKQLTVADFALLLLLYSLDRVLMGFKWGLLLQLLDVPLPVPRAIRIFYQGSFSGVFLPSHVGGDILRIIWVREATGATHPAVASLVMERLLGLLCAMNWGILGSAVFAALFFPERLALVVGLGILAAVGANGLFVLSMSRRFHERIYRLLGRGGGFRVVGIFHRFYEAYAGYSARPRGLLLNTFLTFIEHGLRVFTIYVTALAIGIHVDAVAFLAATTVYMVILRLPIAPDGWGVGELVSIGVYGVLGVSPADAFVVSAVGHIMPTFALLPGFFFLLRGQAPAQPASLQQR